MPRFGGRGDIAHRADACTAAALRRHARRGRVVRPPERRRRPEVPARDHGLGIGVPRLRQRRRSGSALRERGVSGCRPQAAGYGPESRLRRPTRRTRASSATTARPLHRCHGHIRLHACLLEAQRARSLQPAARSPSRIRHPSSTAWASPPADFDNDGAVDVVLTAVGQNRLFRNTGKGAFVDVTAPRGSRQPPRLQHVGDVARLRPRRLARSADLQLRAVDARGRHLLQRRRQGEGLLHARGVSRQHLVALSQQGRRHVRGRHRPRRPLRRHLEVARA